MAKGILIIILLTLIARPVFIAQEWSGADLQMKKNLIEGKYDSALYYAEEAAAIMRGTIGENNLQYGSMLRYLAYSNFYLGNYKKAKYLILKESALWESLRKTNDPEYINCLKAASVICRKSGSYEEALSMIKKADNKALQLYKPDDLRYADILYNYAGVYHDMGNSVSDIIYLNQEEKYLRKAEALYQKYADRNMRDLILVKSDLAAYSNNTGNIPLAESLLQEVAEMCKREFGEESSAYAATLNNKGVLNFNAGNFKQAETYFVEAIAIYKKGPSTDKLQTGVCLNNLGSLYYQIGNYEVAARMMKEAGEYFIKSSQENNPLYSVLLNNQASVFISEEYYASPENKKKERIDLSGTELKKADSVFYLNCQKPHPFIVSITGNQAVWYYLKGENKKAFQIMNDMMMDSFSNSRLVMAMNKMDGSFLLPSSLNLNKGPEPAIIPIAIDIMFQITNSAPGTITNDLQGFSNLISRLALGKATSLKKTVGPYHPAYGSMIKSLYIAYGLMDDVKSEEELRLEYINVLNHRTLQDFTYLSEAEKEMYYQTRLPEFHSFTAYSLERKNTNPQITRYTYNNILLNKGLMLKSSTAMRIAILNSNNQDLLREYDEWIALQKEISDLYSTPVDMRAKNVTELEQKSNELERSLVSKSQDFSDFRKGLQITWEDVKKNLRDDEAAIEFTDFKRLVKDGGQSSVYCALVVRSNSDHPEMVKLFTDQQLKAIIDKGGTNDIRDINAIYGLKDKQQDQLYNLIWKPIEQFLEGITNVYISPSGLLNRISFPAISNGKGVFLCDKYQIQIKGSTGNVASQNLFAQGTQPSALVFGGIQYSESGSGSDVWGYLKGTKDEGDVVSNILMKAMLNVSYMTGARATETFFKENAGKYSIMHLATHGFFFDDPNKVRFEDKKEDVEFGQVTFRGASAAYGVNSFVNSENPLMRSGLVLAGAGNDARVV